MAPQRNKNAALALGQVEGRKRTNVAQRTGTRQKVNKNKLRQVLTTRIVWEKSVHLILVKMFTGLTAGRESGKPDMF